ncbi:Protein of unknown function [Fictibacillus solisalsi]|jgi:2-keto-4-pentenoate hydratase/2-oxohepta-3-ene-1,7-dioic acid hydratase in catechol pathway|uniref:DUF2848 domain-containing protein n=1 Tax=Fictibacillus solisalsi TaxID=459525 RepID=A0A1G9ZYB0_9BACL|nr:DUF2848 family protein [Fictibacillus solisalsi]SDN25516.1 Protein of unknown function [Fictibacillus solisalsi]
MRFSINGIEDVAIEIKQSVCIGYSGRNQESVQHHIDELANEGIPAPPEIPMVYPVSNLLVTQEDQIQLLGGKTSGEVEFVLVITPQGNYVTVGSDHTDRSLETISIPYAKQVCPKPIGKTVWPLESLLPHWDQLKLKCEILIQDQWETYQDGSISSVLPVNDIIEFASKRDRIDQDGTILFCGTVPIKDGHFKYADAYRMTLTDPVLHKEIKLEYEVVAVEKTEALLTKEAVK